MSELAFNLNGDPFEVPANAVGWRVRRMKQKGAPEVVYGRNGLPLVLPIEADLDDVRQETGTPGRYRLDPVDDANRPIAGASAGYVYVHPEQQAVAIASSASRYEPTDNVVIEAMRMNSEIAKSVVDRFPQMLEAAAVLLQAADGAGLPARPGMVVEDTGDDDEEDETGEKAPAFDIGAMLMNAAPLIMALTNGKLKLPDLFNWNKAAQKGEAPRSQAREKTLAAPTATSAEAPTEELTVEQQLQRDPAAMQHFMAIMQALTPEERALAQALAMELTSADRSAWFNELKPLSVADAVAKVRALIGETKKGGVS
jgi:hypothetical protein